jgi:hypothetical protein
MTVGLTQPIVKWVQGFSPEGQQSGHVADHLPPNIAKVNLHEVIPQLPPCVSMLCTGILPLSAP